LFINDLYNLPISELKKRSSILALCIWLCVCVCAFGKSFWYGTKW